uniref:MADS-box protein JOINTLESS n=1 Tax=Cajanus cajan TaxID=3821 RepID=A0A151T2B1_CAJCA|nr:MADS-box protein JOINTLESS [Cajanus cajan]
MTRKRIQIKKIDNISSRQVTFSKRRKGLFKKAQELSTLCDADIALIVFSATSKLFEYASSSMQQVIERRDRHSAMHRLDRPSIEMQIETDSNDILRKKVEDKSRELKQLYGEDLQGLTLQELQKLEELLKRGLTNVSKLKDEKVMEEIFTLKRKGVELMEENQRLKQVPSIFQVHRQSSESIISNSSNFPEDGGSDTSLKLGLVYFNYQLINMIVSLERKSSYTLVLHIPIFLLFF